MESYVSVGDICGLYATKVFIEVTIYVTLLLSFNTIITFDYDTVLWSAKWILMAVSIIFLSPYILHKSHSMLAEFFPLLWDSAV